MCSNTSCDIVLRLKWSKDVESAKRCKQEVLAVAPGLWTVPSGVYPGGKRKKNEVKEELSPIRLDRCLEMVELVRTFDNFLKEELCQSLEEPARRAFTAKALSAESGETYSSGSTFFIRGSESANCLLEKLAKAVYEFHTVSVDGPAVDPTRSGAEWWTQVIDTRDDIGIHWDRDYGLEEETGVHVYPYLGTVTYLSALGGSTIVFDSAGSACASESLHGKGVNWLVSSRPRVGKHLTFDGRLLHAAPSDFDSLSGVTGCASDDDDENDDEDEDDEDDDDEGVERITFLVNIWVNHVPLQSVRYTPSPEDMKEFAKISSSEPGALIASGKEGEVEEVVITTSGGGKMLLAPVSSGDKDYLIPAYQPIAGMADCMASTTRVNFASCAAKVVLSSEGDRDDGGGNDSGGHDSDNRDNYNGSGGDGAERPAKRQRRGGSKGLLGGSLLSLVLLVVVVLSKCGSYVLSLRCGTAMRRHSLLLGTPSSKYVTDAMQKRIDKGTIDAGDLRRVFGPTKRDVENLRSGKIAGKVGIIVDLEGALVDLTDAYVLSYRQLANSFRQEPPTIEAVRGVIGLSIMDAFISLGWNLSGAQQNAAAARFAENFKVVLKSLSVRPYEGAGGALDQYISDGNPVVIMTKLPRDIAVRCISKAGLSPVLEGRVEGSNLSFYDAIKDRRDGQQLIRSVALLRMPLELVICITANSKTILSAKRVGMTVAGVRHHAQNLYALRTADTIVTALKTFPPRAVYDIICKSYINNLGPSPEPMAASDVAMIKTKTVLAPAVEDDGPRDTFADEFGSDLM